MKVVDKMNAAIKSKETFYSFEFFPPRTDEVPRLSEVVRCKQPDLPDH